MHLWDFQVITFCYYLHFTYLSQPFGNCGHKIGNDTLSYLTAYSSTYPPQRMGSTPHSKLQSSALHQAVCIRKKGFDSRRYVLLINYLLSTQKMPVSSRSHLPLPVKASGYGLLPSCLSRAPSPPRDVFPPLAVQWCRAQLSKSQLAPSLPVCVCPWKQCCICLQSSWAPPWPEQKAISRYRRRSW